MNTSTWKEKIVLYVDDEPQAIKYFEALFGDQFRVEVASSAQKAWDFIEANASDIAVLITDQRMPETTGTELMEMVRARYSNIVRVLTTAFSNLDAAIQAVNDGGAFRYLTKPWDEGEMIGTLMRAIDFHNLMQQRDQLMREKLSVLHRLVVMDRVRGLATATAALDGRIRNAWQALAAYIQQSPVGQQIQIQMQDIAEMNMVAVARKEAEQMIQTVQMIVDSTILASSGDEPSIDMAAIAREVADSQKNAFADDDINLQLECPESLVVPGDAGMFKQMILILIRRLADVQEKPATIKLTLQSDGQTHSVLAEGNFGSLTDDQLASFFAAAIPLRQWPIGLDMDLLSVFLTAYHFGGTVNVKTEQPAMRIDMPCEAPAPAESQPNNLWFDQVYDSLKEWEREFIPS